MFKFLIFLIMIIAVGCSEASKVPDCDINSLETEKKSVANCNFDLEETIKSPFNGVGLDEDEVVSDENFLKELKNCPREETIDSLLILQNKRKDDFEILAKTSYLLVKLGHKKNENGKILASSYLLWIKTILKWEKDTNFDENFSQDKYNFRFGGHLILGLLWDVIENDDKEIISEAIDLAIETDNASAEVISHLFGREFEKNPEEFLKRLKPKSKKTRQRVYNYLYYSEGKQQMKHSLSSIPKNSEIYPIVNEIEKFAKTNKYVLDSSY